MSYDCVSDEKYDAAKRQRDDERTLHNAAANGHSAIVSYLLDGRTKQPEDELPTSWFGLHYNVNTQNVK